MNNSLISLSQKSLEKAMDLVAILGRMGENAFLSRQAHSIRLGLDRADDLLRDEESRIILALEKENDQQARALLHKELKNVRAKRAEIEKLDDELAIKDHSYKKAISKLFEKANSIAKSACSGLDLLIEKITAFLLQRRTKDVS